MEAPQVAADHHPNVEEIHVLWSPDGMSCDGDTVSVTNATQPSIEDLVMGAIPGLPKVHLHNRVLAYSQGGQEYLEPWFKAARGELDAPFILVIEGSIPNESIKEEGYWAAMGNDPETGEPIEVWEGRYGPYVKHKRTNASLPDGMAIDAVTMEEALKLLEERQKKKGKKRRKKKAKK